MAYTTAAKVRAVLPNLLIFEDDLGLLDSGTYLTLHDSAFDVPTLLKDSTTLTKAGSDYTFVRPRKLTLASAATGENFIAKCYIGISDTDIDTLIGQADQYIDNYFTNYDTPDSSSLEDWSSWLSASLYLRQYCTATEENIARAEGLWKLANDAMEVYRENTSKDSDIISTVHVRKVNG